MERHRHHSVHEVYLEQGTGQGTPRARDRAREAAGARQDDERGGDQMWRARRFVIGTISNASTVDMCTWPLIDSIDQML